MSAAVTIMQGCGENNPEATMKPINEKEFEMREAQVAQQHLGRFSLLEKCLAAINLSFQSRNDPTRLTARIRRDAGIDELEIERRKLARAPLIC